MVFRSSKRNENTSDTDTGVTTSHVATRTTADQSSETGGWSRKATLEETEAHFGMDVPDKDSMFRLQRLEAMNTTERVRGWVDEGMTIEDMGNPLTIEAFRERQAERPPEVPTNIERQNKRSVQRSEKAASKTSPAGETGVPDPVRDVISSTGRSLDASIQRTMEDRMGESFSDVQIHTGAQAATACESINARAFTVGNHIAFNSGEYDPSSAEGQHVIAHELAHVRQQTSGAISMLPQEGLELEVDPDPALEREAEETAQEVMAGGELGIQRMANTGVHIQRLEPASLQYVGELLADKDNRNALANATKLTAEKKVNDAKDALKEKTTREYRLTHAELQALVQNVDHPEELQAYFDANDIEPTSEFEETVDNELRWSIKLGDATFSAATLLSLGFTPSAIVALATGYGAKKVLSKYGDEIGESARELLREHLGLSTGNESAEQQEIGSEPDAGEGGHV